MKCKSANPSSHSHKPLQRDPQRDYQRLGLAQRAGALAAGSEAVRQAIRRRQACLVILAQDLSPTTAQAFSRLAAAQGVPVRSMGTAQELGRAIGKPARGVLAITDPRFAVFVARDQRTGREGEDLTGGGSIHG
ncbi:MAG: ribosomal L7Ae/L30e/S12e/Gadd45 family protein [Firmicutes bacterium]|nr:ribosomal L7Ae/L30e/S12e/Gadd45 family protein [Bacillota bacterium]